MAKFIRPTIFLKGDKTKSFGLIGQANAFLQRTLNWKSGEQFVRRVTLNDGSTITIQRLLNGEFLTFIESLPPVGGEEVCRFFTSVDSFTGTNLEEITNEDTREPVIVSISGSGNVSSEKAQPIIIDSEEEQIIAGNIDFKGKYTWQGPLGVDRPEGYGVVPPKITFRPGGYFQAGLLKTFLTEHFSRFDTRVYLDGEILLDTVDNTIAPGELVLGYCNGSNYQMAITWGGVTNDDVIAGVVSGDNKDNVWLIQGTTWSLLGEIEYYPDSDLDSFMLGRGQCITFSEDCTLFTGVTLSTVEDPSVVAETSNLIKGIVNFDLSTNLPTSISVTLESTLSEDINIATGGTTLGSPITHTNPQGNDYTLAYENTFTKTTTNNIVNKIPISSAYTSDNILNVLYLNKFEIIDQIDDARTAIDFDFFLITSTFFTTINSNATYVTTTFKEYTTTSGRSFSYSTSQDTTITSVGSAAILVGNIPETTVANTSYNIVETEEGVTELKYINLRDDVYIYDKIDKSNIKLNGTYDYTLFSASPFQLTEVIDRDITSINYNLILNKENSEIVILNRDNEEALINTNTIVSTQDSALSPFFSGNLMLDFTVNSPPTLPTRNFDVTIGPDEARLANVFREEYVILFGPANSKYSQSLFYTTCKDTGISLLNYIGVSGRLFEIQGVDYSDVPRLNLTTAILKDNTLVPIDLKRVYASVGISPEPPLSRIWADRRITTPALNNSNRDIAICLI